MRTDTSAQLVQDKLRKAVPVSGRDGTGWDCRLSPRPSWWWPLSARLFVCLPRIRFVRVLGAVYRACGLRPPSRGTRVLIEKQSRSMQAHLSMVERHRKAVLDCKKTPHAQRTTCRPHCMSGAPLDRPEGMPMASNGTKLVQCARELPGVLGCTGWHCLCIASYAIEHAFVCSHTLPCSALCTQQCRCRCRRCLWRWFPLELSECV